MPMVVYTEEEVIDACNKAAANAVSDVAEQRDRAMVENTAIRKKVNDLRDMVEGHLYLLTAAIAAGDPGDELRFRIQEIRRQLAPTPAAEGG